jgi:mRNA-degrading endonuclease RelE of RelBE toxin-antitoxin system
VALVEFTPDAVRQFKKLPKLARAAIKEGIQTHLVKADPGQTSRNKFRLRRVSPYADYELRLGAWRVFYRIVPGGTVVTLLGEKRGSALIIEGEEIAL